MNTNNTNEKLPRRTERKSVTCSGETFQGDFRESGRGRFAMLLQVADSRSKNTFSPGPC